MVDGGGPEGDDSAPGDAAQTDALRVHAWLGTQERVGQDVRGHRMVGPLVLKWFVRLGIANRIPSVRSAELMLRPGGVVAGAERPGGDFAAVVHGDCRKTAAIPELNPVGQGSATATVDQDDSRDGVLCVRTLWQLPETEDARGSAVVGGTFQEKLVHARVGDDVGGVDCRRCLPERKGGLKRFDWGKIIHNLFVLNLLCCLFAKIFVLRNAGHPPPPPPPTYRTLPRIP